VLDVLGRSVRRHGLEVMYVQNVTDVDDDLLKRARRDRRDWRELTAENVAIFRDDLEALNVRPPDHYPYASEEIGPITEIVADLLRRDLAYRAGGNVYFRVSRFPAYGQLCGLDEAEMLRISAERGADPSDPRKERPLDFILWQAALPDEPSWPTPWGDVGRPGWHIECSAMVYRYLGPRIDIHGGGGDLVFPHHESEIAQSESFTGQQPMSRFWVHCSMLRYQGEKMSKSLGNMVFVRDLRRRHSADAIRLCLLRHHYRAAFDFEDAELVAAQRLADRLKAARHAATDGGQDDGAAQRLLEEGYAAIDDDLDTPGAIAALAQLTELPATATRQEALAGLGACLGLTFDGSLRS
jgi:L-cysteine:1D-myo-inositol 2-amino-2-deoxy-alpha-D-glucopyranoside ligase